MTTKGLFAAVAIVMAAGASSVIAQEPAAPPGAQGPTFRSGVDLITVDVGVVDGRGNPGGGPGRRGVLGEDRRRGPPRGHRRSS